MKAQFIILTFFVNSVVASNSVSDTLKIIDRPDFCKTYYNNHGDTTYFSYFITSEGFLDDESSKYDSTILYKLIQSIKNEQVGITEFINKGNGSWYAIFYDKKGSILMQGALKETGQITNDLDTLTVTSPDPPYKSREIAFRYHKTVKEGYWILHESQWLFKLRKIYYLDGIEQH